MRARRYGRWSALTTAAILVACGVLAATASAALANGDYMAVVSPGSVAPAAPTTFTLTLTNISRANPLGAAIVSPPAGFVVTAVSRPAPSGNSRVSNGQVVLKGLSLHFGETETVSITATARQSCEQASWSIQAFKSSLNGRQLSLDSRDSSLATTVTCDMVTEPCPAGGACVPATVTTPTTSFTVTAGPGPSAGTLTASVDPGNPLVCSGYTGIDSHWYGFLESTFERAKTLTVIVKGTPSSAHGVELCFGAPYEFETLSDADASRGTLPDGTQGFVGLLERCDGDEDLDPCVQSITTVPDESVGSGFDTVVTAIVPRGLTGDPFAHP